MGSALMLPISRVDRRPVTQRQRTKHPQHLAARKKVSLKRLGFVLGEVELEDVNVVALHHPILVRRRRIASQVAGRGKIGLSGRLDLCKDLLAFLQLKQIACKQVHPPARDGGIREALHQLADGVSLLAKLFRGRDADALADLPLKSGLVVAATILLCFRAVAREGDAFEAHSSRGGLLHRPGEQGLETLDAF